MPRVRTRAKPYTDCHHVKHPAKGQVRIATAASVLGSIPHRRCLDVRNAAPARKSLPRLVLLGVLWVSLCTGCTSTRPVGAAVLGAGGAAVGSSLSHGSPAATAAGAAGGVLISEGLHYLGNKQSQKAWLAGYDKGKSDAVKQQYWLQVSQQRPGQPESRVRLYPVHLPAQRIDGVTYQPTVKYLRIEE